MLLTTAHMFLATTRALVAAEDANRTSSANAPLALHPDNPHYFVWRGKPTVLITSGGHYGSLLNGAFDYVTYFDALAANKLNHTRTFSGAYREIPSSFGITDNPLAPKPDQFVCPWPRSDQPGANDGQNKFDLERWNDAYFTRLKDYMRQAGDRGIVVELTLFCPMYNEELWKVCPMNAENNVQGIGKVASADVYTLKHPELLKVQRALTEKLVRELNVFDNLYFEVCNEPYFGGVTQEWQDQIADLIAETERALPNRHLISMNIANGTARVKSPHAAVSILNFHYCVPPKAVADNYHLGRVIGENETGFRGKADVLYRTEAWDFMIAGGGLFNNLDYSFTTRHPDGTFRDYQSPGGGSPELRRQLQILKEFLEGFSFVRMQPDGDVIQSISGGVQGRALSEPGRSYAIYLHVPIDNKQADRGAYDKSTSAVSVSLALPAGKYTAEWVDTKSGEIVDQERFDHQRGERKLKSPDFLADIALRVMAAD